jgi:hypothetical protein
VASQNRDSDVRPWTPAKSEGSDKADALPKTAGIFEWRVPHAFLKDLRVVFLAHIRMRGGCGDDFLFPTFDRWTGWKAVIPMGVEWREAIDPPAMREGDYRILGIDVVEPEACPFCGTVPRFQAWETGGGQGIVVCGVPHRYDSWSLTCCSWAGKPSMRDPRELIAARAAALARQRPS